MISNVQANLFVDAKNLLCPMPIIKLAQGIKQIDPGQTLVIEATDPGSRHDMAAWARQTGNELVETEQAGRVFRYLIRRTR